jgi:transposase
MGDTSQPQRITAKTANQLLQVLDEIHDDLIKREKTTYPYAEWERRRTKVKDRLRRLPELIHRAAHIKVNIHPGRPNSLSLEQRTMLLLFARMTCRSNRDVEDVLGLLCPLFGFTVSYKTVERLYSDPEVRAVLRNLLILLMEEDGVSGEFTGDGSGYSLSVCRHYRSEPSKSGVRYRYVFHLVDIHTGLIVGFGYSCVSEMDAFRRAMVMVGGLGVAVDSLSLDRYYSSCKVLEVFGSETALFLIPKRNISRIGFRWAEVVGRALSDPVGFLGRYFERSFSEVVFSAVKRRFGWVVRQRRPDRQEGALFTISLLHNLFTVRVDPL